MNKKKEMIIALKTAIKVVEKIDSNINIPVVIIQYRVKEKEYITDIHTI